MKLPGPLRAGRLLRRLNRFTVEVQLNDGLVLLAHLANSGRLSQLLVPRRPCLLVCARPQDAQARTHADLAFVAVDAVPDSSELAVTSDPARSGWVSVSAMLPNQLVAESLATETERWRQLLGWRAPMAGWQKEVRMGRDRLDFWLGAAGEPGPGENPFGGLWLEVKSVTDVQEGWARFPDAPTARGRRHLLDLTRVVQQGGQAGLVFVVQREDPVAFAPNWAMDPSFGAALRAAAAVGVKVWAFPCRVRPPEVQLVMDPLPVQL